MRKKAVPYCAVAVTAAAALFGASQARGATTDQAVVSQNWAGYEAAASSTDQRFSKVSGSWVQPNADCSSGDGDAAFWVGLGGGDDGAQGLEQVGTEVDCSSGQPQSHAWYELIPAAPVNMDVDVNPGDHISASVNVDGNDVTVYLKNDTTGKSQTKNLSTDNIDVSTAEWIAEAPSQCSEGGCTPVTLADFGSVGFTSSSATSNGHTGSISDSAWNSAPLALSSADGSSGGAQPGSLSSDGSSFSVSYQSADSQVTDPYSGGGGSVSPYGGGDPYGNGGDPYGDGGGSVSPYSDGSGSSPYGDGSGSVSPYDGGGDPYGGNPYDDGGSGYGYGWDGSGGYGGSFNYAY
jgi:hypothetical protein